MALPPLQEDKRQTDEHHGREQEDEQDAEGAAVQRYTPFVPDALPQSCVEVHVEGNVYERDVGSELTYGSPTVLAVVVIWRMRRSRSPIFRFWLQAAVQRIVIYVGFTSSSGHSDAPTHRQAQKDAGRSRK